MKIIVLTPDIYKRSLDISFMTNILKQEGVYTFGEHFIRISYGENSLPFAKFLDSFACWSDKKISRDDKALAFVFLPELADEKIYDKYISSLKSILYYMVGYLNNPPVIIDLQIPYIQEGERPEDLEKGNDENE